MGNYVDSKCFFMIPSQKLLYDLQGGLFMCQRCRPHMEMCYDNDVEHICLSFLAASQHEKWETQISSEFHMYHLER
jgi:hypothetical protein